MDLNGSLIYEEFTDTYTAAIVDGWSQTNLNEGKKLDYVAYHFSFDLFCRYCSNRIAPDTEIMFDLKCYRAVNT